MKPKAHQLALLSFLYWGLRRLFELVVLSLRSEDAKEVEIMVLRHQLLVLKRQVRGCRRNSSVRAETAECRSDRRVS